MYEGSKKFIYKIIENEMIKKTEVETGVRNQGNIEMVVGVRIPLCGRGSNAKTE